jgi:hypothetical protein
MSISQRQHTRFSLDIPATLVTRMGEKRQTLLQQISVGGCFTQWEDNIYAGDEFRLEIELPAGNRLPLKCKALYRFEDSGIGVRFVDISVFEQELVSEIIADRMAKEHLPIFPDPLARPVPAEERVSIPSLTDDRAVRERMLEEVMSGE